MKQIRIEITNNCNLRCRYCIRGDFKKSKYIDKKVIKKLISNVEKLGATRIVFSGGEPLLHPDIFELIKYGKLPKIIMTNGVLLDGDMISKINCCKKNIEFLKISLDGFNGHDFTRGRETSEIIRQNLRNLQNNSQIPFFINTVVSIFNLNELEKLYMYVKNSGAFSWGIYKMFPAGRASDIYTNISPQDSEVVKVLKRVLIKYLNDRKSEKNFFRIECDYLFTWEMLDKGSFSIIIKPDMHPCEYHIEGLSILNNGDVTLCSRLPIVFGNIYKKSLEEILEGGKWQKFRSMQVREILSCRKCKYLKFCGGGCRANVFREEGSLENKDIVSCQRMRLFEREILPILPKKVQAEINKNFK